MKLVPIATCTIAILLAPVSAKSRRYPRGYIRSNATAVLDDTKVIELSQEQLDNAPDEIDWTKSLTPVKDQGNCGSCWAFSSVSTAETALYLAGEFSEPTELSTEELVDCVKGDGCRGGDITDGIDYLAKHGVALASDYPDTSSHSRPAKKGSCKIKDVDTVKKITGRKFAVPQCRAGNCAKKENEEVLAAALAAYGPIAICVNAADSWDDYESGVLKGPCGAKADDIDHCVQLVGYNKVGPEPYWIVRNSWTDEWGEKGFIRIPYGDGNKCCVACEAVVVEVGGA